MANQNELRARVAAIQDPLLEAARSYFSEVEIQYLRGLVRLAVEFDDRLHRARIGEMEREELQYLSGSVLGGLESFVRLGHAYYVLIGSSETKIGWQTLPRMETPVLLEEEYVSLYRRFLSDDNILNKCGLVLDLYKIQLMFVAITYVW